MHGKPQRQVRKGGASCFIRHGYSQESCAPEGGIPLWEQSGTCNSGIQLLFHQSRIWFQGRDGKMETAHNKWDGCIHLAGSTLPLKFTRW